MEATAEGVIMAMPDRISTVTPAVRMMRIDIHISRTSIFLPRYSGVRPIISPETKTAMMAKASMV